MDFFRLDKHFMGYHENIWRLSMLTFLFKGGNVLKITQECETKKQTKTHAYSNKTAMYEGNLIIHLEI